MKLVVFVLVALVASSAALETEKRRRSQGSLQEFDIDSDEVPSEDDCSKLPYGRLRVVCFAHSKLNTVAQDATQFWNEVRGSVPESGFTAVASHGKPRTHWCGIFALWALHHGLGVDWTWKVGSGFALSHLFDPKKPDVPGLVQLRASEKPDAGDIGYIDQPYQHFFVVRKTEADGTVRSVDGNSACGGKSSAVCLNKRKSIMTAKGHAFWSIGKLVDAIEKGFTVQESAPAPAATTASESTSTGSEAQSTSTGEPERHVVRELDVFEPGSEDV